MGLYNYTKGFARAVSYSRLHSYNVPMYRSPTVLHTPTMPMNHFNSWLISSPCSLITSTSLISLIDSGSDVEEEKIPVRTKEGT